MPHVQAPVPKAAPKAAPREQPKAAPREQPKAAPKEQPKAAPREQPKTDWMLIEGNGRTVLKTIAGILKRSGDSSFSVEFRIFQSSSAPAGAASQPKPKQRRRGLGSLTSIFVPRRKRKR